ncbi:MAG: hypothetical protein MK000_08680 [Anaerolineales bacterium]|nr:hypothetical protein [Anaerolineales bacterium]
MRHYSKYHGEWIALIGDELVGNGRTADEAREAALAVQPNVSPHTVYIPEIEPLDVELPEICTSVLKALPPEVREQIWLVGGAVRAVLTGREIEDLDFVLPGDALAAARTVADTLSGHYFPLDEERGMGRVLPRANSGMVLDFARMHVDGITADLLSRDFTINAMALPLGGVMHVLDPSGGREHLQNKVICKVSDTALKADPIRVVRAVRLAVELGFRIEPDTRKGIREVAPDVETVSVERKRDELMRCLGGPNPTSALRALDRLGVLLRVLPEWNVDESESALAVSRTLQSLLSVLRPRHDVDAASEFALGLVAARVGRFRRELSDYLSKSVVFTRKQIQLLYLGSLLRIVGDVTKVQEGCRTLRLSKVEMKIITAMVQSEGIPVTDLPKEKRSNGGGASGEISLPLRTIHRFYHTNGVAGVEVCLISLAEVLAAQGPELNQREWAQHVDAVVDLFDAYFNRFDEVIAPPSLINGRELMQELGIPPGARVGMFLSEISEAQACGEVTNRSQAIELARKLYGLHK